MPDAQRRWRLVQQFALVAGGDVYLDVNRIVAKAAPLEMGDRLALVDEYLDASGLRERFERFA